MGFINQFMLPLFWDDLVGPLLTEHLLGLLQDINRSARSVCERFVQASHLGG